MRERLALIILIAIAIAFAGATYVVSGQYAIALALLIGLFPVVMSLASR